MNRQTFDLMKSNEGEEWYTPMPLFNKLNEEFHFTTDPCAEPTNRLGLPVFYTREQNGLKQEWKDNVFINPVYGKKGKIDQWFKKALEYKGGIVVFLVPARTDTKIWHTFVWDYNKPRTGIEIRFIKGRLKFEHPTKQLNTAPFPSVIIIFRPAD